MSTSKVSNSTSTALEGDVPKKEQVDGKEKDNGSKPPDRSPSPDKPKCAICLGDVVNKSRSNSCVHSFCFGCLLEWSKQKPECPLCKSSFTIIYHNFRSNTDYDEYVVPTPVPHFSIRFTASAAGGSYRLSPFIRVLGARAHQHSPLGHAYDGVSIPAGVGVYPPPQATPPMVLPTNPFNAGSSSRPEYFGDVVNDHRRTQEEAARMPGYQNRRRRYDRDEWVQPFGSTLQPGSIIFPSLEYIRTHPTALSRVRNWLYRELSVLLGLQRSREQLAFVYDLIIHLINHYDIRSRDFRDMINPYFGSRTSHFQHELFHFILSGMGMDEYDRAAEYPSASTSGSSGRRNGPPEVITLDSEDEEDNSNSNNTAARGASRPANDDDDIIVLSPSSDEEYERASRRRPTPPGFVESATSSFSGPLGRLRSEMSTAPRIELSPAWSTTSTSPSHIEMPDPEPERPLRHTTNRARAFNVDPEMPVLEPEVFPNQYLSADTSSTNDSFPPLPIPNYPGESATVTNPTQTGDVNLARPSVLSGAVRSGSSNDWMESEMIDLDLDVSVYSSPPRDDPRPLGSPDFPILQLRRRETRHVEEPGRNRNSSTQSSRPLSSTSENDDFFLNLFNHFTDENANTRSGVARSSLNSSSERFSDQEVQSRGQLSSPVSHIMTRCLNRNSTAPAHTLQNLPSSSSVMESGSAFVPYEPESRESLSRPPRPSCIHEGSSHNNNIVRYSSLHTSNLTRSASPPFRINLYPRGISSSQVMDLSRSAGLISSSSSRPSASITRAEQAPPFTVPAPTTSSTYASVTSVILPPSSLPSRSPASASSSSSSSRPTTLQSTSFSAVEAAASSFAASLAAAAGGFPKREEKKATETINDASANDSDDDELECLGSFPIVKKPPLAVITLSSDDENEREERVKAERNENDQRLNLEGQDNDSNAEDAYLLSWRRDISSGSNPTAGTSIETSAMTRSQHYLNVFEQLRASSQDMLVALRREVELEESAETGSPEPETSKKSKKSSPPVSPRKKSKRLRISSSSEESDDENDKRARSREPRQSQSSSASSTPVKIPKKRRYIETSPSPVVTPPHFTSSDSSSDSTDNSDDEDYEVTRKSTRSKASKKRTSSKKKRKSKSKKKKAKKNKSKEKSKEKRRSRSRSGGGGGGSGSKGDKGGNSSSATGDGNNEKDGGGGSSSSNTNNSASAASSSGTSRSRRSQNSSSAKSKSHSTSSIHAPFATTSTSLFMSSMSFEFQPDDGLLDLSFDHNFRVDHVAEDLLPGRISSSRGPSLDFDYLETLANSSQNLEEIPEFTTPAIASTVDASAIFDSPSRQQFLHDFSSSYRTSAPALGRNTWDD